MRRRTSITSIACAITLVVAVMVPVAPSVKAQQPVLGSWSSVQSVAVDDELDIKLKNGKSVQGKFLSANDTELSIIRKGKSESFARATISQVYHSQRKAEKGKYAAIGAGIGAGAGLGIGLAKNSPAVDDGEIYPKVGAGLGAGIGAIGGFLFGQAKRKRVLIYQV